jgi:hypothetical protein
VAAILQRISHQHRGHREQAEQAQRIHSLVSSSLRSALRNGSAIFRDKSICAARFRATSIVFKSIEPLRATTLV